MKKIIFLTRSYPDTLGSATILCMHRVLNCVASSGKYEVHALCVRYPGEELEEKLGNVIVHRFDPTWWVRMRNDFQKTRKHKRWARITEVITKIVTIPFFPRTEPITAKLYYRAARKLHIKNDFDLVVSEHHGLSTLLTGCQLMKDFTGLKHIAILWDPVKGQMATEKLPKSYTDKRIRKLESFITQYTTLQISMLSIKAYHEAHGDIAADRRIYLDIPGVLRPEAEVPTEYESLLKKGAINIVFSGLLSEYYRDARPIIRLLNQCEKAEKINILFFSRGERDAIETEGQNFKGTIVYHDYIPLKELHTLYRHADYLLNVSHINANMVPSKIFEYMSYGKPIISTYISDGDIAQKYINRYPEGLCIDLKESDEDNSAVLDTFLNKGHLPVPFEKVHGLFRDNTPEKYLEVIDVLINICHKNVKIQS